MADSPTASADSSAPNPAREIEAWGEFEDALRDGRRKAIAAPRPDLYDVESNGAELNDLSRARRTCGTPFLPGF